MERKFDNYTLSACNTRQLWLGIVTSHKYFGLPRSVQRVSADSMVAGRHRTSPAVQATLDR
jgi:hypothetical protein